MPWWQSRSSQPPAGSPLYLGCAAVTNEGGWGGGRELRRGIRRFRLPARRSGHPLPGAGPAVWLINGGRTAVVQAGGKTVKLTIRGGADRVPPGAVIRLAAVVAERLAERSEIR